VNSQMCGPLRFTTMQFFKSNHFLSDYRKGTREHIGTFYASREKRIDEKKIITTAHHDGQKQIVTTLLEGPEFLSFKNYVSGASTPISSGKFLNHEYDEMVFEASLPEKDIVVSGVISKISETTFLSTKTFRQLNSGVVSAVLTEVIEIISEQEFPVRR
jgi:hypothetical protein